VTQSGHVIELHLLY